MTSAVHNYACYRAGEDSWAQARFIMRASRLEEFENEMREVLPELTESNSGRMFSGVRSRAKRLFGPPAEWILIVTAGPGRQCTMKT